MQLQIFIRTDGNPCVLGGCPAHILYVMGLTHMLLPRLTVCVKAQTPHFVSLGVHHFFLHYVQEHGPIALAHGCALALAAF
jgi:hypothetical protein